uniref:Lipoprotein n=1 Tax=Haemonchus contortus TaxID=6289 RepID=A0A7I5E825_HAECO
MIKWIILVSALCFSTTSFIIGGCIGPKSVLERYLNPKQKVELRKIIHTQFDGKNAEQVLAIANTYVHSVITPKQWLSILPELRVYQTRRRECSIYSQLLPTAVYKQLLNSVWAAMEHGVNDSDLKRLVDEYVDRAIKSGMTTIDKTYTKARPVVTTTPKTRIFSNRLISEIDPQPKATKRREYPSYRRLPSGNIDVWVP